MEKMQEGLVKGVLNGDCVILSGKIKKNCEEAPEEKTFYLSLVSSPRCGTSNNVEEEAFAWDARDFLRQKVLGKVVKYSTDYKNNDKTYGQIIIDGENMNVELVKKGLAKIGFVPKNDAVSKGETFSKLQAAENEAKKNKLNIWNTDSTVIAAHKRTLKSSNDVLFDSNEVLQKTKNGKELSIIVDYVINCAVYVVFIKELNTFVKLNLRFVGIPNSQQDPTLYKAGKAYAERLILHKDITCKIYSVDVNKSFLGDLIDKKGNSIAELIIKNGYSKMFILNSTPYNNDELKTVKDAQRDAKKEKLRIWKNEKDEDEDKAFQVGEEKTEKKAKSSLEFQGVCVQVHSGDSISVKNPSGEVLRIFLSHMKAPKFGKPNTEEQDQPWAFQAKEFLRKITVGKKLRCEHDYSKTLEDGKKMNFYSIFRFPDSKEQAKQKENAPVNQEKNVNVEILELGYAQYVSPNPKLDDDVSKYLDSYQAAEKIAKEKKQGIHSTKYPGNPNYSDLIASNKTKKKEFINFLVNQKGLHCVVEYCFTGSKFKLRIEKNKCYVPFSLLGIKVFGKDKNTLEIHDKFCKQAIDFANDTILQREGTCDIVQADRVGNYFGYLTINGNNFATTLCKEGLAVASAGLSTTAIVHMNEFKNAEKEAETAGKNIWAHTNLAAFLKEGELVNTLPKGFEEKHSDIKLRITDYIDFNNFYVNILPNKSLDTVQSVLSKYTDGSLKGSPLEFPVKLGTLCSARYSQDDQFYRAKITKALKDDKFEVELIDFGTVDVVSKNDLIKLDGSIAMIEPQSIICELAYLKYSQNSMKKALETITDFVNFEKELSGKICYTYSVEGKTKIGLLIYTKDKKLTNTYHQELLKLGYAKFDIKKSLPDYLNDLKETQNKAEKQGSGLWAEHEDTDYDENDEIEF
jgi:staphylococcal nuclease domain-containing protein 1